jgi:protein associated with RNAse G/E
MDEVRKAFAAANKVSPLLDEDEFADHTQKYGYPREVQQRARQSAEEIIDAVTRRARPFDLADAGPTFGVAPPS